MTDAEYIFKQTSSERKRVGRGDFNKKRQGGKTIRFPSDNLTRREKAQLNSEVKVYSFSKPLTWKEFLLMPVDIKQEYLDTLTEKFNGIPSKCIAMSLGKDYASFNPYLSKAKLKIKHEQGKRPSVQKFLETEDGKAWVKWHSDYGVPVFGTCEEKSEAIVEGDEKTQCEAENHADDSTIKIKSEIDKVAMLISSLAGSGAKLTIEITL